MKRSNKSVMRASLLAALLVTSAIALGVFTNSFTWSQPVGITSFNGSRIGIHGISFSSPNGQVQMEWYGYASPYKGVSSYELVLTDQSGGGTGTVVYDGFRGVGASGDHWIYTLNVVPNRPYNLTLYGVSNQPSTASPFENIYVTSTVARW